MEGLETLELHEMTDDELKEEAEFLKKDMEFAQSEIRMMELLERVEAVAVELRKRFEKRAQLFKS